MKKHGQAAALRHHVPGLFIAALGLAALAALSGPAAPLLLLLGAYAILLAGLSLVIAAQSSWRLLWRLPLVVITQHLGYGLGTWIGLWDAWRHGRGRERFASLTR